MVCSHMAPYTGEEVKYSMQSPPWSTDLLQLRAERLRGAGLLMRGAGLSIRGAMDAQPLCTKTTAKAQREAMVSCRSGPRSKDHSGQAAAL